MPRCVERVGRREFDVSASCGTPLIGINRGAKLLPPLCGSKSTKPVTDPPVTK